MAKTIIKFIPRKIRNRLLRNIIDIISQLDKRLQKTEELLDKRLQKTEELLNALINIHTGVDFRGQAEQDKIACLYLRCKKDGFYVDIGANDGITYSNTIVFENMGWKGVCIEPLPDVFALLRRNRRCDCFNVAIADISGDSLEFIRASGVEVLSGLSDQMTEAHKDRIVREKGIIEKISVKTLTFSDLMDKYSGRRYIDFLSLDVEGAEMSILKSIDFKKFSFGIITVENNEEIKGNGENMKKYMSEQGYKVYLDLGLDIMFIPDT